MTHGNDRGSKWLIEGFGESILHLAGVTGFTAWRAVAAELVAPRRTPDGLIEAFFPGRPDPTLYLIEIETYESRDTDRQVYEDLQTIYLSRRVVPEVIVVVLRPHGNVTTAGEFALRSPSGRVRAAASWPVTRLYMMEAEDLFAAGDAGLVPWATLAHTTQPPEEFIERCRDVIVTTVPDEAVRKSLLAVTHILAGNVYNNDLLNRILRGKAMLLDSPTLREAFEFVEQRGEESGIAKGMAKGVALGKVEILRLSTLELAAAKFDPLPEEVTQRINGLADEQRLRQLVLAAGTCADLPAFLAAYRAVVGA